MSPGRLEQMQSFLPSFLRPAIASWYSASCDMLQCSDTCRYTFFTPWPCCTSRNVVLHARIGSRSHEAIMLRTSGNHSDSPGSASTGLLLSLLPYLLRDKVQHKESQRDAYNNEHVAPLVGVLKYLQQTFKIEATWISCPVGWEKCYARPNLGTCKRQRTRLKRAAAAPSPS